MSTSFPSALDSLVNPVATQPLNNPPHSEQHANANDAITALEAKVGINGSTVPTSLDYRVAALEVAIGSAGGMAIGGSIAGSPVAGALLFSNASSQLAQDSKLVWDATNHRLGIGTNAPAVALDIRAANKALGLDILGTSFGDRWLEFTLGGSRSDLRGYFEYQFGQVRYVSPYSLGFNAQGIAFGGTPFSPSAYFDIRGGGVDVMSLDMPNGDGSKYLDFSYNDRAGSYGHVKTGGYALVLGATYNLHINPRVSGGVYIGTNPSVYDTPAILNVQPGVTTQAGLIVTGMASQTGNLFEAHDSSGTVFTSISNDGKLASGGWGYNGYLNLYPTNAHNNADQPRASLYIDSSSYLHLSTNYGPLVWDIPGGIQFIQPMTFAIYSIANPFTFRGYSPLGSGLNSLGGGAVLFNDVQTGSNVAVIDIGGGTSYFSTHTNTLVPVVVRGLSSQSGNLTEWQNSSSVVGSSMSANGQTLTVGGAYPNNNGKIVIKHNLSGGTGIYGLDLYDVSGGTHVFLQNASGTLYLTDQAANPIALTLGTRANPSDGTQFIASYGYWWLKNVSGSTDNSLNVNTAIADVGSAQMQVTVQRAALPGFILKAASAQSANLTEWQSSTGTVLTQIGSGGSLTTAATLTVGGIGGNQVMVVDPASTNPYSMHFWSGAQIRWATGSSAVSGGTEDVAIKRNAAGILELTDASTGHGSLILGAYSSSTVALKIQGAASQSASLTEWQNSSGTVKTYIDSVGRLSSGFGSGTQNERFGASSGNESATGGDNAGFGYHTFASLTSGTSNMAFGSNALSNLTTGQANVAIGFNAMASATITSNNMAIGQSTLALQSGANGGNVAIGSGAAQNQTNGAENTVIGTGAGVIISYGSYNVLIGANTNLLNATDNGAVAIGRDAVSTGATFVGGSSAFPMDNVYFGKGITNASPTGYTINGTGGSGSNIAGASLTLAGGKGTGNAAGGSILFQTSDAGSTGTTLQSLTTKMTILANGNVGIGGSPSEIFHLIKATGNFTTIRFDSGTTQGYFFAYDGDNSVNIGANSNSQVNMRVNNANVLAMTSSTFTLTDAISLAVGTTTGTKFGTATSQKMGWWNATPVVQQVLATGAGHSIDNVISLLQTLGLCRQS